MIKTYALISFLACVLASTCSAYQLIGTAALSEELIAHHYTINPNLNAVIVADRTIPTFEYNTFYGAGSADEAEGEQGRIHFLEHIMFDTGSYDPGKLNEIIVDNGGQNYAFTTVHYMCLRMRFPKDKFDLAVEIDRDRFYNTKVNEAVVENQKKIILTERSRNLANLNKKFSNRFWDLVYKKQRVVYYQNHLRSKPYIYIRHFAFTQTKVKKTYKPLKMLKNLSAKDGRQYYARLLKTEVVFFKIISNRDSTEITKLLRPITEEREAHLLQHEQNGGFVHSLKFSETDYSTGPSAFVLDLNLKNIWCYWLIPYGSIKETNHIPSMISLTLGRYDARGLLYKYFREELGLVYGIGSDYTSVQHIRFLKIYADPQLHNSEELIRKMSDFIRGLPGNPRFWRGIKELRENSNIAYAHVHERLTPQRKLDNEVYQAIYNPPRRKGGSKSITDAEVRSFLEKFFVPENMIMVFIGPKDNIIEILNANWPEVEVQVQSLQSLQNFLE